MNYKILHLIHSDQRRGAEVFAIQLAYALSSHSLENALCIINPTGKDDLHTNGLKRYDLVGGKGPKQFNRIFDLSKVNGLRKALMDFKPDILISHGSSALKYGAISKLFYRESVNIYRNIGMASFWTGNKAKARLNRFFLDRFELYISLSPITKKDFISEYGVADDLVVTIPNGVETFAFKDAVMPKHRSECREKLGLNDEDFAIVNVGNLSPEKGQIQLLSLIKDIKDDFKKVRLLLVGDGPLKKSLQDEVIRLEIEGYVDFLGTRNDVPSILGASDLFVLPSCTESMSGALIEAGFAGLSSVSYNVGAISDVIENGVNGITVDRGDYLAFKNAVVRQIVDDEERKNMGTAIQQKCRDLFDIRGVATKYIEAIDEVFTRRYSRSYQRNETS